MDIAYESEIQLGTLFGSLAASFARLDRTVDAAKEQEELKGIATKLQEAKALIRDFEKEARTDDMRPSEMAAKKKDLMQQLNRFIDLKKQHAASVANRTALLGKGGIAAATEPKHSRYESMSTQQLMDRGRRDMVETEQALKRSEKVVEDTVQVATSTAETLNHQTEQLERVMDNLDEIQFSLKKAKQVIRDMTRGLATDKCIMFLTMMSILALIIMVVLKVFHIGQHKDAAKQALKNIAFGCSDETGPAARLNLQAEAGAAVTGRRLLRQSTPG